MSTESDSPDDGVAGPYRTDAVGIEGMTEPESASILDLLVTDITGAPFTCRPRRTPGTFVVWDDRLCVHQAFDDDDGCGRKFYSTAIAGGGPS